METSSSMQGDQFTSYPPQTPSYPTYPANQAFWLAAQAHQLAYQVALTERGRAQVEIENDRLRAHLARKTLAEEAYTTVGCTSGRTFTVDKSGRMVELMNTEILSAEHLFLKAPFTPTEFYSIRLAGIEQEIKIDVQDFYRDQQLLQTFQEIPGVRVRFCRTVKLTAALLREAIAQRTKAVELPFYAGWIQDQEHGTNFWIFDDGSTHIHDGEMPMGISALIETPAATMSAAAHRFWKEVGLDLTQFDHWLLAMAFHIAALSSLLPQLGHPFPLAVCVLAENAASQAWLKQWFSWFGDTPLWLSFPPAVFSKNLLCRKDEPLLIVDERSGDCAATNATRLEEVLASRLLPWKRGRDEQYLPLQALPVILSSSASSFTTNPDCITLELPTNLSCAMSSDANGTVKFEYIAAFNQFTAGRINRLQWLLNRTVKRAFRYTEALELTENCIIACGILLAINSFVQEFRAFCGLKTTSPIGSCPDINDWLFGLLEQTSEKQLNCGNLASQFLAIARSMLIGEKLSPCPIEYSTKPDGDVVYFDENSLGFTTSAMNTICRNLGQSRPLVLRALAEADLLEGKPVNSSTLLTRISVWNVHGIRKTERVYLFSRAVFNELGEPLTFKGEEELQ